jgi:hypothetical protein
MLYDLLEILAARQCLETLRSERVQAYRNPVKSGVEKRLGMLPEYETVGGQRQVFHTGILGKHPHQSRHIFSEERLTPGQTYLGHAHLREGVHELRGFLECEEISAGQPNISILGHTVLAAYVAPVRDRYAEAAQGAV